MSVRDQMVEAFTKMAKKDGGAFGYVRKAGPGIGAVTGAGIGYAKGGRKGAVQGALTGAGAGWMPDVLATAAEETTKRIKQASVADVAIGAGLGGLYGLSTGEKGTRGRRAAVGALGGAVGMPLLVRGGKALERAATAKGIHFDPGTGVVFGRTVGSLGLATAAAVHQAKREAAWKAAKAAKQKEKMASIASKTVGKLRSAAAGPMDEFSTFLVSKLDDLRAATHASGQQFVDDTLGKIRTEMPGLSQQMADDVLKKVNEQMPGITERAAQSAVNQVMKDLPNMSRVAGREAAEGFKEAIIPNLSTTAKVVGGGTLAVGVPVGTYHLGKAKTAALASAEVLLSLRERCGR